jgi:hypothetical protein
MKKLKFKWRKYGNYGHIVDVPKTYNKTVFLQTLIRIEQSIGSKDTYLGAYDCFGHLFTTIIENTKNVKPTQIKEAKLKAEIMFLERLKKISKNFATFS